MEKKGRILEQALLQLSRSLRVVTQTREIPQKTHRELHRHAVH